MSRQMMCATPSSLSSMLNSTVRRAADNTAFLDAIAAARCSDAVVWRLVGHVRVEEWHDPVGCLRSLPNGWMVTANRTAKAIVPTLALIVCANAVGQCCGGYTEVELAAIEVRCRRYPVAVFGARCRSQKYIEVSLTINPSQSGMRRRTILILILPYQHVSLKFSLHLLIAYTIIHYSFYISFNNVCYSRRCL